MRCLSIFVLTSGHNCLCYFSENEGEGLNEEQQQDSDDEEPWELDGEPEELDAEAGAEVEDPNEPRVLGGGPIKINIQPVEEGEVDCEGRRDGVVLQENPVDCLYFFLCIQGTGHKIECPKIPDQTYFNPPKKSCGSVSENFCKEVDIAALIQEDEEEAARQMQEEDESEGDGEGENGNFSESRIEL